MIEEFLWENPGETVILQAKIDRGGDDALEDAIRAFEHWVRAGRVYCGDHVPTLGECRGKVVILSRMGPNNKAMTLDGYGQWALDVKNWIDSEDQTTGLVCEGSNYEVWSQDNYTKTGDEKFNRWNNSIFHPTKGAQARRDAARGKSLERKAWVVSYTSCTNFGAAKYPQEMARDQNLRLINKLNDNLKQDEESDVTFLGVVCSDFTDEKLAQLVYRHNFLSKHVSVRGVTVTGEEPLQPITYDVGPNASIQYALTFQIYPEVKQYFSAAKGYQLYAENMSDIFRLKPMAEYASADEYAAEPFEGHSLPANEDLVVYVALDTKVDGIDLLHNLPSCITEVTGVDGDDWSGQTPRPQFRLCNSEDPVHIVEDNGAEAVYWVTGRDATKAFTGRIKQDTTRYALVKFETDWGYAFDGDTTWSSANRLRPVTVTAKRSAGSPVYPTAYHTFVDSRHVNAVVVSDDCVHDFEEIPDTEPTCGEPGWEAHIYCHDCGVRYCFDPTWTLMWDFPEDWLRIPPTGKHTPGTAVPENAKAATCTEDGGHDEVVRCTVCNQVISSTWVDEPALGHRWGEWVVDREATEEEDGLQHRTCSICGETQEQAIPAIAHEHNWVLVERVEPSCVHSGTSEYYVCRCGAMAAEDVQTGELVEFTDARSLRIPAKGHTGINNITPTKDKEVAATCCEPGSYRNVYTCEKCGQVLKTEHVVVPMLEHKWSEPEYSWADDYSSAVATRTCTCDAGHTHSESEVAEVAVAQAVSCEKDGKVVYTATFENEAFATQTKEIEVAALGHKWDEGVVTKEPTCTEDGVRTFTCANDETHTRPETIPATGHVAVSVVVDGTDTATCTQNGVCDVQTVCVVCGEVLGTEQAESYAFGHYWDTPVYEWSDDLTTVTASHTCLTCGEMETETVGVNAEVEVEPTCEGEGQETLHSASFEILDFEVQEKTRTVAALGHDWDGGTVTAEPTCTDEGVKTFMCKNDASHTKTEGIAALGHDWSEWVVTKAATETEEGVETRTCAHDASHVETRAIPKLDPTPGPDPEPEPGLTTWTRLFGDNAFETMNAIVDAGNFEKGGTVVLASLEGYWDALTAAGIAGLEGAPVLMTTPDGLSPQAMAQLGKLAPKQIVVCGGTYWIPDALLEEAVAAAGSAPEITRLAGDNAVGTAEKIAEAGKGRWSDTAIVATVGTFQDALAAAPVSYAKGMPVFLAQYDSEVQKGWMTDSTLAAMKAAGVKSVTIAGGAYWIGEDVAKQLADAGFAVTRRAGETAVETSAAIAQWAVGDLGMSVDNMGAANVLEHYDALASVAFCGRNNSVLVLASDANRSVVDSFVAPNASAITHGYVFGGTASVSAATMEALQAAAK